MTAHVDNSHDIINGLDVTKDIVTPCYAIVYFANESNTNTYFDDFEIKHRKLIVQENNYYPFGMELVGAGYTEDQDKRHGYGYNGKEEISAFDLNWQDYGARNYDSQLGRFFSIDPHCEGYYSWTPFNYVANNPILMIDPDGQDWKINQYTDDAGNTHISMTLTMAILNSTDDEIN